MYHIKIKFVDRDAAYHEITCDKFAVQDGCIVVTNPVIVMTYHTPKSTSTISVEGTRAYVLTAIVHFDVLES